MRGIMTYDHLSATVKQNFVLKPPASLIPSSENFWVIKEDEPELVTDGRRNYLRCGSGELALLIARPRKDALVFRAPSIKGRKRSITIDARAWTHGRLFSCGITAAPIQSNGKLVFNGGFTTTFQFTELSGAAAVQMLPDRHHAPEITRLLYDTAAHALFLLDA